MPWIIGIIIAAICWGISTAPFIEEANHIQLIQQLGLNLRTSLVQLGIVALMFPVVDMVFLKPLRAAMDARTNRLEETYSEAETLKQQMTDLRSSYEQKLAASEVEARQKIQEALSEAQRLKEGILEDARTQSEEIRSRTMENLERERAKMLVDLRAHVVDLTLTATERLIKKELDDPKHRELIGEFIETAEVSR